MKLWLVCFFLLFFAAEGLQWIGQIPWAGGVELPWPTTIVGGLVLAIASNTQFGQPQRPSPTQETETEPLPAPASPAEAAPAAPNQPLMSSPQSISFEIQKPKRQASSTRPPQ